MHFTIRLLRILTFTALASAIIGAATAAAGSVLPEPPRVMMTVTKMSGYVPEQLSYSVSCELRTDGVIIQSRKGTGQPKVDSKAIVYTASIPDAAHAFKLLKGATRGHLVITRGPTDLPTANYTGIIEGDVVTQHIRLLDNRSTEVYRNTYAGTAALLELGDANCVIP